MPPKQQGKVQFGTFISEHVPNNNKSADLNFCRNYKQRTAFSLFCWVLFLQKKKELSKILVNVITVND